MRKFLLSALPWLALSVLIMWGPFIAVIGVCTYLEGKPHFCTPLVPAGTGTTDLLR